MKNKKSIYKIAGILVLLVFMLGLALAGCTAQNKTAGQATTPQTETTTAAETTATETIATTAAETTVAETTEVETQATEQLSEQPNKAKYDEYFSDFYLGKLPRGTQFGPGLGGKWFNPDNMPVKTAVFIASEDEFCLVGTVIKGIPSGSFYIVVYDTVAKKDSIPKTTFLPVDLNAGDFGNADDPIIFPTGEYEFKLYIDDALVVVIPFEVR